MNMPRFTAEAALYPTTGHYQTGRYAITLPTPMISGIYPARDEVIEVHSCAPGWTDYGGTCLPDPLTEPSSGSGTPDVPGGGGAGTGTSGGPAKPPKPEPQTPPHPKEGAACNAQLKGKKMFFMRSFPGNTAKQGRPGAVATRICASVARKLVGNTAVMTDHCCNFPGRHTLRTWTRDEKGGQATSS